MTTLSFSKMFNNKFVKTPTEQNTLHSPINLFRMLFLCLCGGVCSLQKSQFADKMLKCSENVCVHTNMSINNKLDA